MFRGKFVAGLKRAYRHGDLCLPGVLKPLAQDKIFRSFLRALFRQDWVVYAKPPFGGPQHVLHHLARYTHRVAISNHRLVDFTDGEGMFRWKDYAHGNKRRLMTVNAEEFLRRFLLHTLPRGFVRIRFLDFLANRRRAASLALCHQLPETNPRFCRLHQRPLSNPHAAVGPVRFAAARWWSSKGSLLNRSVGSLPGKEPSLIRPDPRLQWRSARRTKSPNIPHRWLAEETAVFAIELAGTLVSDLKGRTCGVQTIDEHASPRCLQPKLLLILKGTHGGQHPEMMVQRGHAHARHFREIFHP